MQRLKNWFVALIFDCLKLFLVSQLLPSVEGTKQEPVNIGFIFSLPWDISNTLRAPLAGPISILLTSALAIMLIIGMAFSPVWYFFGLPPRRYYLHDNPTSGKKSEGGRSFLNDFNMDINPYAFLHGNISFMEQIEAKIGSLGSKNYTKRGEEGPINFDSGSDNNKNGTSSTIAYPDFTESFFLFVPNIEEECRKLMACHAHGFLKFFSQKWLKIYNFFSRKLLNVPEDYKKAIVTGMEDQSNCIKIYQGCTQDIVTLAKSTVFYNIPEDIRNLWQLQM